MNQTSTNRTVARFLIPGILLASCIVVISGGCASFTAFGSKGAAAKDPSRMYQVELMNMVGSPTIYQGELTEDTTVQTALVESGATRRYRSMDISIIRKVEGSFEPLRMVVSYQPAKRLVSPEQDYALLPGDRVVVAPASGFLERLSSR